MFSLYRRHERPRKNGTAGCRYRKNGVRTIKCNCPIWLMGTDDNTGKFFRYSLKTRNWPQAAQRVAEIERTGNPQPPDRSPTVEEAIALFLADCTARQLAPATLVSYRNSLVHLRKYFAGRRLAELDLTALDRFRQSRNLTAGGAGKELTILRSMLRFAKTRKWISENPATDLKAPRPDRMPTMPFTSEELARILSACDSLDPKGANPERSRARARALILTLLYSGFRISDAVKLERGAIDMQSGRLLVRMMKTRTPLYIRLPRIALDALAAVPEESPRFFWSGRGKLGVAIRSARRTISALFDLAQVPNGHPHRFRDTFSVTLLQKGADLRTVQLLLGHTSIKTTEKHYAPFVAGMQKMLDDAVATLDFGTAKRVPSSAKSKRKRKSA